MKFEEIISSFIMVIVTGLVLVGFTIAWYTNNNLPAVTGMEVLAAEMGSVQVALKPEAEGGEDISELEGNAKYAELGMTEYTNFNEQDKGELAPGVSGMVTFYVKPITSAVTGCSIVPMLRISQDGSSWYPVIESVDGSEEESDGESGGTDESGESDGESGGTDESGESDGESSGKDESGESDSESESTEGSNDSDTTLTLEALHALASTHIEFYMLAEDGSMQQINADNPYKLTWTAEDNMTEKQADIYWQWHYEYPFTAEEEASLTTAEKEVLIDKYDEEDMKLGNNISEMKFYVTFSAQ